MLFSPFGTKSYLKRLAVHSTEEQTAKVKKNADKLSGMSA
jgi:hypothetical protein